MELTGAAALRGSLATAYPTVPRGRGRGRRSPARVSCVGRGGGGGFADEGHLRYYEAPPRKAVETVARDLARLRAMGLVAGDAAKEKVLSEATELLLEELNRMRDEEEELKKKMKEEKDAMKALKQQQKEAMKAATAMNCDEDSTSESSESECAEQIMKMSCVATATTPQIGEGVAISMSVPQIASSDVTAGIAMEYDKAAMKAMKKREKEQKKAAKMAKKMKKEKMATLTSCKDEDSSSCSSESSDSECEEVVRMSNCATITKPQTQPSSTVFPIILPQIPELVTLEPCQDAQISSEPTNAMQSTTTSIAVAERPTTNRIEVCMGGKCKKSGSIAVLQEFEKKVGTEGAVVGCKCLGKCGLGPNVRLRTEGSAQKNPLFIGVGLEDVGTIVAGLFGDDDLGMVNN
ncbi:hypothetical protein E2562_003367 [Oryza meyeriana var. granulata]|uniref:Uncharacterized protein n=1 Tax=Oryza meyeriana var. granulata TaxID=110450 RepID=A0A6G1EGR7_9ORYZ|nr:hypothetical protein E2562_003367 [Oryza meyeriana var. granulata]